MIFIAEYFLFKLIFNSKLYSDFSYLVLWNIKLMVTTCYFVKYWQFETVADPEICPRGGPMTRETYSPRWRPSFFD